MTKDQQILQLKAELLEKDKQILEQQQEVQKITNRSLKVYEDNQKLQANPELAVLRGQLDYQLQLADKFVKSGAFPKSMTPEQCYTIMKAGEEMGMKELESLQALYIVNGAIKPHGDKMIARLTANGYRVEYLNENDQGVDVRVYHPDPAMAFDVTEKSRANDPQLKNSKAINLSKRNKLRFHGIRLVVSFHLPHLFSSITDYGTSDFIPQIQEGKIIGDSYDVSKVEHVKQRDRIIEHIKNAKNLEQLKQVRGHVVEFDCQSEYDQAYARINNRPAVATDAEIVEE